MKRFLYRSSVEEAVHALHAKIRSGAVNLGGDTHVMPYSGVQTFLDHGVARPHVMPAGIATSTVSKQYESHQQSPWLWRNGFNVSSYDYGKTVRTGTCACCGEVTELEGTSVWWGIGGLSYLNGNTEEHPTIQVRLELQADIVDDESEDDNKEKKKMKTAHGEPDDTKPPMATSTAGGASSLASG